MPKFKRFSITIFWYMEEIKDRFSAKAIAAGLEIKELIKEHGDKKIG